MNIGDNIRKYRTEKQISQEKLAVELGISSRTLQSYEANKTEPSYSLLKRIANILDIPTDLLTGEESYSKQTNRNHYSKLSEEEITNLLESTGLSKERYIELSETGKKDFINSLSDIHPLKLKVANYLDNFENFSKQDLINLCNDFQDYYNSMITNFINKDYSELANDYNKVLEIAKFQEKRIDLLESTIDKYNNIYNDIFSKVKNK